MVPVNTRRRESSACRPTSAVYGHIAAAQDKSLAGVFLPDAIALANIATVSIDFTRRDSRGELAVLPADEPIAPAGTARD